MSAFMCDFATFDYLATAAHQYDVRVFADGVDPLSRPEIVRAQGGSSYLIARQIPLAQLAGELYRQNLRSILERYPDVAHNRANMPGNIEEAKRDYAFRPIDVDVDPLRVIKAAHCLDYQACETDDYGRTFAKRLLDALIDAATHELPGYDDAPWGLEEQHVRVKPRRRVA